MKINASKEKKPFITFQRFVMKHYKIHLFEQIKTILMHLKT
jgi:hypothetical protein